MTSALAPTQGKPCRRTVGLPSVIDLVSISLLLARIPRQPEPCAPRGRGPERQDRGSPRLLGPARPAETAGPCAKRAGDAGGVTPFRTVRCLRLLVHYVGCREVCTPRGNLRRPGSSRSPWTSGVAWPNGAWILAGPRDPRPQDAKCVLVCT